MKLRVCLIAIIIASAGCNPPGETGNHPQQTYFCPAIAGPGGCGGLPTENQILGKISSASVAPSLTGSSPVTDFTGTMLDTTDSDCRFASPSTNIGQSSVGQLYLDLFHSYGNLEDYFGVQINDYTYDISGQSQDYTPYTVVFFQGYLASEGDAGTTPSSIMYGLPSCSISSVGSQSGFSTNITLTISCLDVSATIYSSPTQSTQQSGTLSATVSCSFQNQ